MYSAQLSGISCRAEDFIDDEFMEEQLIDAPAKDIAQRQQNWDPIDQPLDEDVALSPNALVGPRVPPIPKLREINSLITSAISTAANMAGLHLSMPLQGLLDEGPQPQSKSPSFAEVSILAELKIRPFLRGIGRLASPAQDVAISISKELSEAANASPPSSPYCSRGTQDPPWRIDKP